MEKEPRQELVEDPGKVWAFLGTELSKEESQTRLADFLELRKGEVGDPEQTPQSLIDFFQSHFFKNINTTRKAEYT